MKSHYHDTWSGCPIDSTSHRLHGRTPSIETIMNGLALELETATRVKKRLQAYELVDSVMDSVNTLICGFGVEYIAHRNDDQYNCQGITYINMGDTYTCTICYDWYKNQYYVTDWGSIVEKHMKWYP